MRSTNIVLQTISIVVSILILTATTLYIPVVGAAPSDENSQSNNPLALRPLPIQYTYDRSLSISPVLSTYIQTSDTDMDVWLNVTISNLMNSTLENVLVHDIFTGSASILSSTPLYSLNGSEVAWSMGDFRPYESKNITMKITVDTSTTSSTTIDSGFSVFGTLNGGPIYSYADGVVMLPSTFGEYLINTVDANITDFYIIAQAQILSNNPEEIFEFARDEVGYESYNGSLRGARGTLWSMAGNSMDQSSLLVALLRANGIPARYVSGTLSDERAKELIASMFVFPDNVIGSVPEGAETADPLNDTALMAEAGDHTWVEYYSDLEDQWTSLDPSFKGADMGASFTTADEQFTEIPDSSRHKVAFKLKVEKQRSTISYPLTYTMSTSGLYGKKIALGHDVSIYEDCIQTMPAVGCIEMDTTITYQPYLLIGDEKIYGASFQDYFKRTDSTWGTSRDITIQCTGEWLQFEVDDLTENSTHERMIFDKIGYVNRKTGAAVTPDINISVSPVDIFGMVIAPGEVPSFASAAEMFELFPVFNEMNETYSAIEDKEWDEYTDEEKQLLVDFTTGVMYIAALKDAEASDFTTDSLANFYLTNPYFDSPRIIMASHVKYGDKVNFGIDLRKNNIRAVLYPGQLTLAQHSFLQTRGISEASIEGTVIEQLTNQSVITVPKIFKAADKQNISVRMFMPATDSDIDSLIDEITNLSISNEGKSLLISSAKITPTYNKTEIMNMNISEGAKYRIIETLESGKGVIVPEEMVTVEGVTTIGWWELNPETHEIIGVMENGLHWSWVWIIKIIIIPIIIETLKGMLTSLIVDFSLWALFLVTISGYNYVSPAFTPEGWGKITRGEVSPEIKKSKKRAADAVELFQKSTVEYSDGEYKLNNPIWGAKDATNIAFGELFKLIFIHEKSIANKIIKKKFTSIGSSFVLGWVGSQVYGVFFRPLVIGILSDPPLSPMLVSPDSDSEQITNLNENSVYIAKNKFSDPISESLLTPNLYSNSNRLNLSTTDNATSSLKYSSIDLTDADISDADNNFIGHYDTIEIGPLSEDSARVYDGLNFSVNGNGSISSYSPATCGIGLSINWTSFNRSTDKLILEINDGSISADGFAYSGHYTLNADSAEIDGNGPMALTFANDAELDITGGSLVIGGESSYSGFTGAINVSEFNQTYDTIDLNGDFDRSLSTHLEPENSVINSFTNVTLNLIVESNADDTYEITSTVTEGWGVITNSDGTITVIPEKGASPGKYRVSVTTVSTTEPELLSTTSASIEIATSTGVDAGITKEELIYVPLGDNINNGIFSAYQLSITNRGSTDQTFGITTAGIPDEWVLLSRNDVTVPAGKTHLVGLYIKPTTIISQTTTTFTATVTSISDPAITDSVSADFEMPVYRGVDVSTTPCLLYAVANGSASFDLNVSSQSNIGDIYNITVELPDGWTANYVNSTPLDTGKSFRQQVSITTDNTCTGEVYFVGVSAGSIFKENASDYDVLSLIVVESLDDTEPPFITNAHATGITNNSAVITWNTDEMSDSLVKYGIESGNYSVTAYNEINATFHSINLAGLSPGTTYYYAVNSTDQSNNSAQSTEYNFTTLALPDSEPPGITNVMNTTPTGTSVTIAWDTDEVSDSLVRYGTEPGDYTLSASNESFVLEHSVNLIVLNPNTVYHYVVNSTDQSSNSNESAEYSFTTAASPDTTPPAGVSYLNEIDRGVTGIQWSWTNPSDPDFNHTEIYLGGAFRTITSAEHFNATNLTPGTEYTISTRTVDTAGNINQTWVNDAATTLPTSGTTIQLTISLKSGWNLISAPLNLATWKLGNESMVGDPLNVTPENSLTSIYRYNTTSELFEKCTHYAGWGWESATGSESFTELEPGRGYWVMAENDCALTFTGTAPSDLNIPLDAGWNCIGWHSTAEAQLGNESLVGDPLSVTPENSLTSIYRYNTTSESFEKCTHYAGWGWEPATGSESFTELEPGRGYWVMADGGCVWNHET